MTTIEYCHTKPECPQAFSAGDVRPASFIEFGFNVNDLVLHINKERLAVPSPITPVDLAYFDSIPRWIVLSNPVKNIVILVMTTQSLENGFIASFANPERFILVGVHIEHSVVFKFFGSSSKPICPCDMNDKARQDNLLQGGCYR